MAQFTKMDILVQLDNLRKVYIFFDKDLKVVGVNCREFKTQEGLCDDLIKNAKLEKGETDPETCGLRYEDVDQNVEPDDSLSHLFLGMWDHGAPSGDFFQVFDKAMEKHTSSRHYLVFSLTDNKLYSLEVLHGEVDQKNLARHISTKIRGDFEFMEVSSDYQAGNMVELIKP